MQYLQVLEQTEIMGKILGEPKTWIKDDPLPSNSRPRAGIHTLTEKSSNLSGDIPVARIVLHITWLTPHVHQTHRQPGRGSSRQRAITRKGTHIIDQTRPKACAFKNYGRGGSIDGNDYIELTSDGLHNRRHAIELFSLGYRPSPWPRGLTTNINKRCPSRHHCLGVT